VEAQACGTPVIAFGKGGALESVVGLPHERATGVFFREQTVESLIEAVNRFEKNVRYFDPRHCRRNAERFSAENFKAKLTSFVEARLLGGRTQGPLLHAVNEVESAEEHTTAA